MRSALRRIGLIAACAAAIVACDEPRTISIEVTTGHEDDTFTQEPAVTRVDVIALDSAGNQIASASSEPGGTFSLGELSIDEFVQLEVLGTDADGDVQVRGRSLGLVLGALEGDAFAVFAQRINRWSRPPSSMTHSHRDGIGDVLAERFLMLTGGSGLGGDDGEVAFYDLLALGGATGGTLSLVPKSMAISADTQAGLFIDDERALWLDFQTGDNFDVLAPSELGAWSQVAGGQTVQSPTVSYIVGATRSGEPSDRVIVVSADRNITVATLTEPRSAAAATWVEDVGLVISGGSDTAAGIEVIADEATSGSALPYAPDPTSSATAATGSQSEELIVACGSDLGADPSGATAAPIRLFDLRCNSDCAPALLSVNFGVGPMHSCRAFTTQSGRVIVSGTDPDGLTRSFALSAGADELTELPLREPRRGATSVPAPNGTLALLGGADENGDPISTVELLYPDF